MRFLNYYKKQIIVVILSVIILGCNFISSLQDSRWYESINISLISFEESPSKDGTKTLTFQSVIQNFSNNNWITINLVGFSNEKITTAEGFSYNTSNRKCYTRGLHYLSGEDVLLHFSDINKTRMGTSFSIIPPGFQTLTCLEEWQVSEFATEPIKSFRLNTNKGSAEFKITLSPQEVIPFVESPFAHNISWADYFAKYQADANVLDLGQSIEFDFGTITFEGFHRMPYYNRTFEYVILKVENTSQGYPLDLDRDLSGIAIDSSVGFYDSLRRYRYFDDLKYGHLEYTYVINPGQTNYVAWAMWDVENILYARVGRTFNHESPFPHSSSELLQPRCVIIPTINWRREDMRPNFQQTEVNLIACQDQ